MKKSNQLVAVLEQLEKLADPCEGVVSEQVMADLDKAHDHLDNAIADLREAGL